MTETSTSGVDLARVALKAAREAARTRGADAPGGRSSTTRPTRRTTVRTGGREPIGLGAALAGLVAERAWDTPTTGGGILDQWAEIAPELVGKVQPVHFDARTGRLDLQPASPAYATQLRLLGRQLVARINGKVGRTIVRDLRVLAPRAIAAGPDQRTEHHQAVEQPEAPARTRNDVTSPGFHRALAEIQRAAPVIDPAIAAAIGRQEQAILNHREPWDQFAQGLAEKADQENAAASQPGPRRTPRPPPRRRPAGPRPRNGVHLCRAHGTPYTVSRSRQVCVDDFSDPG
ncbi:DciA family protein [Kitasatospora sp. NPDC088351]|uniref:DciA family protein n=1 Tax=Kitasatospora sp. NPDC088351 TaxID=3155180 RepID=UPI00343148BE